MRLLKRIYNRLREDVDDGLLKLFAIFGWVIITLLTVLSSSHLFSLLMGSYLIFSLCTLWVGLRLTTELLPSENKPKIFAKVPADDAIRESDAS